MRYLRFIFSVCKSLPQNPSPDLHRVARRGIIGRIQSEFPSSRFPCSVSWARSYNSTTQESGPAPPEAVSGIVDELLGLTLLEVSDLVEVLREKLGVTEMPTMMVMMPGMVPGGLRGPAAARGSAAAKAEDKVEKTVFDLKLEALDAAAKIKVIKEVRTFTDLGLKEAKELVEKAPTLLKKGVTKEEAEKIIEKLKEIGAKVSME